MTILTYQFLMALCLVTMLMAATWMWAVKKEFYSIVDAAWSYSFAVIALLFYFTGNGWPARSFVFAAMVCIWSLRLGTHLSKRLKSHYPKEDGRYTTLREQWKNHLHNSFLIFFLAQGASVVLLSMPMLLVSLNPGDAFIWIEYLGIALWIVGICGETIADRQLMQFKKDPARKGQVCNVGLWKYSRHPNYFFEWIIWISYFVFACASPLGYLTFYCPLIVLYLLLQVTGIPATEEHSLRRRGDLYREYQRTTSMFIPWFPKKSN